MTVRVPVLVGGKVREVEVTLGPDGRPVSAAIAESQDTWRVEGPGFLARGPKTLEYRLHWNPDGQSGVAVIRGRSIPVSLETAAASRPGGGTVGGVGASVVRSPMNGVVLSVKCEVGEAVAAGTVVLVLEAMKMENEVMAPAAGVVKAITVQAGATVAAGAPLFTIEPA